MRNVIEIEDYINQADASVDIFGEKVEIAGQSIISIQFVWDEQVTGVIDMQVSNKGKVWTDVDMGAEGPNGVVANSEMLELKTGSKYVRGVFKPAPGSSGVLTAHFVSKREG